MLDLNIEEKETVIETLQKAIPRITRRQLECLVLFLLEFTQTESGTILGIAQQVVSEHLGNIWDILGKS